MSRFRLDIGKKSFTVDMVMHRDKLSGELEMSHPCKCSRLGWMNPGFVQPGLVKSVSTYDKGVRTR